MTMYEGAHIHCLSTLLCPGMSRSFDLRTIIMITIGGGILAGMFLLIGVVLCLYTKIAKALNSTR